MTQDALVFRTFPVIIDISIRSGFARKSEIRQSGNGEAKVPWKQ